MSVSLMRCVVTWFSLMNAASVVLQGIFLHVVYNCLELDGPRKDTTHMAAGRLFLGVPWSVDVDQGEAVKGPKHSCKSPQAESDGTIHTAISKTLHGAIGKRPTR